MVTVSDFLKNLRGVDINSLTDTIIKEEQVKIIDLNREDQIFRKGIDADGKSLPQYKKATQSFYNRNPPSDKKGQDKSGTFNLFWTGESYKGFKAWREGLMLYVSTNARGVELFKMNGGSDIFGFTTENDKKINWEIIAPKLNEKIRKILL